MTRASVFAAVAVLLCMALSASHGAAQSADQLDVRGEFGAEADSFVRQAVLQGFERVDSVDSVEADLQSGQRLPFRVEAFDGGFQYLVLVFAIRCPACSLHLELADPATGQMALTTTLVSRRTERLTLGSQYVDQSQPSRARLSAYAEGGPHRMLAMLLRRPL